MRSAITNRVEFQDGQYPEVTLTPVAFELYQHLEDMRRCWVPRPPPVGFCCLTWKARYSGYKIGERQLSKAARDLIREAAMAELWSPPEWLSLPAFNDGLAEGHLEMVCRIVETAAEQADFEGV